MVFDLSTQLVASMVGMFVSLCLASKMSSKREFFVPVGMHLGVKLLMSSKSGLVMCPTKYYVTGGV